MKLQEQIEAYKSGPHFQKRSKSTTFTLLARYGIFRCSKRVQNTRNKK